MARRPLVRFFSLTFVLSPVLLLAPRLITSRTIARAVEPPRATVAGYRAPLTAVAWHCHTVSPHTILSCTPSFRRSSGTCSSCPTGW